MQGNRGHNTIRLRMLLSYFAITVLGFGVVLFMVSQIVEDYFVRQRVGEVQSRMQQWSDAMAIPFEDRDGDTLYRLSMQYVEQNGGHLLLLDEQGVVQVDTVGRAEKALTARRLAVREVREVLWNAEQFATQTYRHSSDAAPVTAKGIKGAWQRMFPPKNWAMQYVIAIPSTQNAAHTPGVLLYSADISDVMSRVSSVRTQITVVMISVLGAMIFASYLLARSLTHPIGEMTRVIRRMARGELSLRVPVRGRGELAELAQNFNDMSEKIENTDRFRNEFVSNASHELKTPLATMKILIETLIYQDTMDEGMTREFLTDINKEIDRLNGVITDLLHLVQVDKHAAELKREMRDVSAICADVVKRLAPIATQRNIEVETSLSPCMANIDPIKMDQVILNLTENAIKYSNDGSHVLLRCNKEGGECVIRVKDNGVGIPEEDQKHVFDRFYRVDKARSRETGGTGLGLSIVEGIVKMHGGTISVQSQLGEGSEFTVRVPLDA